MPPTFTEVTSFSERFFPDLDLGDRRRRRRFDQVAQALLEHPQETLPDKFHDPAGYQACLRLLESPRCTHENLLSCHQVAVLTHLEAHPGVVVFVHDTTHLDFSGHATLYEALGPIGNGGGRGYLAHHTLAVDPTSREVFGLVSQLLHVRMAAPPGESSTARAARTDRESRLWSRALTEIGPTPAGRTWVDVADRGADVFDFLQALVGQQRTFVVRSAQNRALEVVADSPVAAGAALPVASALLHETLRKLPAQTSWTHPLPAREHQPARQAQLRGAARCVTLRVPARLRTDPRSGPLTLWALRVWEEGAPPSAEALEWILLTSVPLADEAALRQVVHWYTCRTEIEEYHKVQKTGVGIERFQVQSAVKLQALIALASVVAVALLNLRVKARDPQHAEEPAERYVPPLWVAVLSRWRYREVRPLTVRVFTLALGRLGGHLNRRADGLPGWITLWRGWERLQTMIEYEMSREQM